MLALNAICCERTKENYFLVGTQETATQIYRLQKKKHF